MISGVNLFFDFIGWAREGLVEGSPYSDGLNVPLGRPAVWGCFAGSGLLHVEIGCFDDALIACHPDTLREASEATRRAYREMLAVTPVESIHRIRTKEEAKYRNRLQVSGA